MSKVQSTAATELASTTEAPAPAPRKQVKPILASKMGLQEYTTQKHVITLGAGESIDDCFDPRYWSGVSGKMKRGDRIDVHSADASWFGELYVRHVSDIGAKGGAQVALLRKVNFDDPIESHDRPPATHEVKFLGPNSQWGVVDVHTGKVAIENLPDKQAADQFVRNMR